MVKGFKGTVLVEPSKFLTEGYGIDIEQWLWKLGKFPLWFAGRI